MIRVFRIVSRDGDIEYWATNDLAMDELTRLQYAEWAWGIENYHRGLKQYCGVERAQVRAARAQRNHIGLAIRAFLRLEQHFYTTGVSWYEAKTGIIRDAVRAYLAAPRYTLPQRNCVTPNPIPPLRPLRRAGERRRQVPGRGQVSGAALPRAAA